MAQTIKLTRKELFDSLWSIGYDKTAQKYTVSLNDILDVCKRSDVPIPYETYFLEKSKNPEIRIPSLPGNENDFVELSLIWKRKTQAESSYGNKANSICIYQVLEDYSRVGKPLSVTEIIKHLEDDYRLKVDRRTVYTTIEMLCDLGYDIQTEKKSGKNYYTLLDRFLDASDVQIILDSLLMNPLLSAKKRDELINTYSHYLMERTPLRRANFWHSLDKFVENYDEQNLTYEIIDTIDEAITQGKCIEFNYMKYAPDGELVDCFDDKIVLSPCMIHIENFMYYLAGTLDNDKELYRFRLDRIKNAVISDKDSNKNNLAGYGKRIDRHRSRLYFFNYTLRCDNELLETFTDDFAHRLQDVHFTDNKDNTFTVNLWDSFDKLLSWAAGHADQCEVLEPIELRDAVIKIIKNNKYNV